MPRRGTVVAVFVGLLIAAIVHPLIVGMSERTWSSGGLAGLAYQPGPTIGTPLTVRLTSTVRSTRARVGDGWTGIVVRSLVEPRHVILAGTQVDGVVTDVREPGPGMPAMVGLAVRSLTVAGRSRPLASGAQAFVAATPRPLFGRILGRATDEVVLKPRTVVVFSLDERMAMR